MASEQRESASLPGKIEAWLADHTADIEQDREDVLARAVESYQRQMKNADRDDVDDIDADAGTDSDRDEIVVDDTVDTDTEDIDGLDDIADIDADTDNTADADDELPARLSDLESRLDELEAVSFEQRLVDLETELDDHVEDLRGRIVDVVKEARRRAPADHQHTDLEEGLAKIEADLESNTKQLSEHDWRVDEIDSTVESVANEVETTTATVETLESKTESVASELETTTEVIETLESKADRLAGVVVDLRRRLGRVERHMSHETALAELLETAAREGVDKAKCQNCNERVALSMLVEPACPHCRSVFEEIDTGSGFFSSASLVVADRPALEAGKTADKPFGDGDATESKHGQNTQ